MDTRALIAELERKLADPSTPAADRQRLRERIHELASQLQTGPSQAERR